MKAFGILIDRYKNMIFTLGCRMLRNKEDAEEMAQDTFLKAYKALGTFKGTAKFSTWLYKIAYHKSLDQLKKRKRHIASISLDKYEQIDIKVNNMILEEIEKQERARIIKSAIDQLREEDAVIVTLYYFDELSIREIAEIVSLNTQLIKVRLFRSRKQLAILLSTFLTTEKEINYEY